jgi:hypothetical protein
MPLPWIIGGAVLWAGKKIYDNYQESEEDDRRRRNREYEREQEIERAQEKAKIQEQAARKKEIVSDAKKELTILFKNHSDLISSISIIPGSGHHIDRDQLFSALNQLSKNSFRRSMTEEAMLAYLQSLLPDAQISEKQNKFNKSQLTLQHEIDELTGLNNQLSQRR